MQPPLQIRPLCGAQIHAIRDVVTGQVERVRGRQYRMLLKKFRDLAAPFCAAEVARGLDQVAASPGGDLGLYPGPVLLHPRPCNIPRPAIAHLDADQTHGILILYFGRHCVIQSADDQRRVAELCQGQQRLTAKLRIAGGLSYPTQLIEECCVSVLRSDAEGPDSQCGVDGSGIAKILLRNLPRLKNDLRISADVAQEFEERRPQ